MSKTIWAVVLVVGVAMGVASMWLALGPDPTATERAEPTVRQRLTPDRLGGDSAAPKAETVTDEWITESTSVHTLPSRPARPPTPPTPSMRPPDETPVVMPIDQPRPSMRPPRKTPIVMPIDQSRPFSMGPTSSGGGANDRVVAAWRTLRRGRLAPPAALLRPAVESAGAQREVLVFRRGARRAERIIVTTNDLAGRLEAMSADPSVVAAVENIRVCSYGLPATELASVQWALQNDFSPGDDIGWSDISAATMKRAPSATIGLVDAAIDFGDRRLAAAGGVNVAEVAGNGVDDDGSGFVDDVHGYNFVAASAALGASSSRVQHGSFVASIMAARPIGSATDVVGVCPRAKIVAAVVLAADRPVADPWRAAGDLARVIEGIRYVVDRGARVVNLSFGAPVRPEQLARINRLPIWDDLERRGVILVCAAGNANTDIDREPVFPASLPRPNVLTVMAVDAAGRLGRAQDPKTRRWRIFTNYGARTVDLAAPGTAILGASRRDDVALLSGTSYAAAITTAAVALVWGRRPEWDVATVIDTVCGSVRPLPSLRGRCRTAGVLNLAAAMGER